MKKVPFLLLGLMLVVGCTTAQPEPTSTPLPPTEPPPPTDTSVPPTQPPPPTDTSIPSTNTPSLPTQTPNPHAEEVLQAVAEAIKSEEYENVRTFLAADSSVNFTWPEDAKSNISGWLQQARVYGEVYIFSDFIINGDNVKFKWIFRDTMTSGICEGKATMEEDKILFLERTECK